MLDERECGKQTRRTCTDDGYATLGVVHILEMRWFVERDRRVFRQRCAMFIGQYGEVHLELLLASINRTLHDTETLFHVVSFLWG